MIVVILILSHLMAFLFGGLIVGKYMLHRSDELYKLINERLNIEDLERSNEKH